MRTVFNFILMLLIFVGCSPKNNRPEDLAIIFPESFSLSVSSSADIPKNDESVYLEISELKSRHVQFNEHAFFICSGENEIPSQTIDSNNDGELDLIIFNTQFVPNEKKELTIRYHPEGEIKRLYEKRTQAEVSIKVGGEFVKRIYVGGKFQNVAYVKLPQEHTDHSEFIRYEGPGWESDKVGYRFYLDWRNATDVFGKKVSDMVLKKVGQDGFTYHTMADWGMDVLKVGNSLGIGSVAMWKDGKAVRVEVTDSIDCEIVENGSLYSQVRTRYSGWKIDKSKYNLISDLSISAGSRITRHDLLIIGSAENLCSGLAKYDGTEYFQSDINRDGWAYIALYGKQSLAGDNLGTAILFDTKQLIEITEDELNHVVVMKPESQRVTYYFLAAWEQEPTGIKSKQAFLDYLDNTLMEFNQPMMIRY